MDSPVIIVGGGLAGISCALALAPLPVLLVCAAPLGEQAASGWAQGGIAAAVGADDTAALHAADTIAAGDGLCDPAAVARITAAGPALIASLTAAGTRFDRTPSGSPALGLEAAHSRRRIVHAGDATGAEIMRALIARLHATPSITVLENHAARALLVHDGAVTGISLHGPTGDEHIAARQVVLATGGIGGLFAHTTNPRGAWGQGLWLAGNAGAVLRDLEFVQFHPTALAVGRDPMPLVSEAVRGEGATLIDEAGLRFMKGQSRAELEPRDVVSRAVWAQLIAGHSVYLDASAPLGADFATHFPTIAAFCAHAGIDPARAPIPIRPAAHYHMGGIAVDADGATSVPGLYACGECAATGLHGANRLASNSLLEAAICGQAVAHAIAAQTDRPRRTPARAPATAATETPDPTPLRPIVSAALGVLRDEAGLLCGIRTLLPLAQSGGPHTAPAAVALAVAVSALQRRESRGGHWRTDHPTRAASPISSRITLAEAIDTARALTASRQAA